MTDITLTGGEPLLQEGIDELIDLLSMRGFHVEIETNGAVSLLPFCQRRRPSFTMDYKLPGSGCEKAMVTGNFALLTEKDTVKFVVSSTEDLQKAEEIVTRYDLVNRCAVYISPVFGSIDPAQMVDFMKQRRLNGWRLQLQLHKFIWDPEKRGV